MFIETYKIFRIFFILSPCLCFGQNLVPNGSFETYTSCPTTAGDFQASNWWGSSQTPDYFNACANTYTNGCSGVPFNANGYQNAFEGNAYCGVYTSDYNVVPNYREYISAKLTTTLTIGVKYYFSMQISSGVLYDTVRFCSQGDNGATNKIGALFTTYTGSGGNYLQPKNFAHVYESTIITDTTNWVQVKGSFIADSAYQYINLGNFFDDNNTDTLRMYYHPNWVNPAACIAFYYVDDVILSTDSSLTTDISKASIEGNIIYPNPVLNDYFFLKSPLTFKDVRMYNHLGKEVGITSAIQQDNIIKIAFNEEVDNGVYILRIISENQTYHYSIIKN